jgi:hypothetical protein
MFFYTVVLVYVTASLSTHAHRLLQYNRRLYKTEHTLTLTHTQVKWNVTDNCYSSSFIADLRILFKFQHTIIAVVVVAVVVVVVIVVVAAHRLHYLPAGFVSGSKYILLDDISHYTHH